MRMVFWAVAGALFAQQVCAKDSITSAYTDLKLDDCKVISLDEESESIARECVGYDGMPVYVAEGDLRTLVSYGDNAKSERAAEQTFGSFNHINTKLEWRLKSGDDGKKTPFATILRFFLQNDDGKTEHPILVVTQVKPGATCHVAYIDAKANKNANADARAAADRLAGTFNCEAEPEIVGPQTAGVFME